MNDLEYFRHVASDNKLRSWLEAQKTEANKYLSQATEMPMIFRAQGKVQLVEKMLELLDKAKNLR